MRRSISRGRGGSAPPISSLAIGPKYTRPELARAWGYESHHAIVILFVTRLKQEVPTQYADHLSGDLLFREGQEKHGTDDRIINAAGAGDEVHLFYREVHHCPFEYKGRVFLLDAVPKKDAPSQFVFRLEHDQGVQAKKSETVEKWLGILNGIRTLGAPSFAFGTGVCAP